MSLKTKSIYDEKVKSDGVRILVTRFYPRGIKRTHFDLWFRNASPEAALLKKYKTGALNWREFSKRFKEQLRASLESKKAVQDLIELLREGKTVTLLCYEREGQNCHRYLLKSAIGTAIKKRDKKTSLER
jgi:uncharacterized protein YeaO (DUF488 family)